MQQIVLSSREAEVLSRVAAGWQNKEIASDLQLSQHTVVSYVVRLLRGLKLRNRVELAAWAFLHPHALAGCAATPGLHQPGCGCNHPYCTMLRKPAA